MTGEVKQSGVLLVDPDDGFRSTLADGLRGMGFAVTDVSGMADALEIIAGGTHPALVCEMRFDEGSGIDLVSRFAETQPQGRAVILSAFGDLRHATAAAKAGARDYLVKPASAEIVAQALVTPLNRRIPPPNSVPTAEEVRRDQIDRVLRDCNGSISEAARRLKIDRRTLQRTLRRQGIPPAR